MKGWGWKWVAKVTKEVTKAERRYRDACEELDGCERLVKVLSKLRGLRSLKHGMSEDVNDLDEVLGGNFVSLRDVLVEYHGKMEDSGKDFDEWADDVKRQVESLDELFICFDSEEEIKGNDERVRRARRKERRNGLFLGNWRTGQYKKRVIFLTFAWFVALAGLIVTIGYLTKDFIEAQRNLAVQLERSPPKPQRLPAITFCSNRWDVPMFSDYPTREYPGLPLFGVSLYIGGNRSSNVEPIWHPATLPDAADSPVEAVTVSANSKVCLNAPKGFDVERERQALYAVGGGASLIGRSTKFDNCVHCLRIGVKRPEILPPNRKYNESNEVFTPAVQVSIFNSRMYDLCQVEYMRRDRVVDKLFSDEIFLFAKELEDRGILDFNNNSYSVLKVTGLDFGSTRFADFYCNVYFFSGFFYPSLDKADISYRYNASNQHRWEKTGRGPYYSAFSWNEGDPLTVGPNITAVKRDIYVLGALRLYVEDADNVNLSSTVKPETGFALLSHAVSGSTFTFKKVVEKTQSVQYEVKEALVPSTKATLQAVDIHHIGFDFNTFEEEEIFTYPTMTWPEFITDVFEFIGLFTGVCIFTLIAGSANRVAV